MIRTQIQLEPRQARQLKAYSQREGISMAEAIRRIVDAAFASAEDDREDLFRRAAAMVGALSDPQGATDLAQNHDDYLEDAFR